MLDIKLIRSEPNLVAKKLLIRGFKLDIDYLDKLEFKRRELQEISQNLQSERNTYSKMMGKAISEAKNQKDIALLKSKGENLKKSCSEAEYKLDKIKIELDEYLRIIPNLPDDQVPSGANESDNLEIRRWGSKREFSFKVKNHVDLGEITGMLDFESGVRIASSRFSVMKGDIARMHRALCQYMLDTHQSKHGYEEVNVPLIVNKDSLFGTGQLPKFEEDLFKLQDERNLYLIPTAEVPVTNIYRDQILDAEALPIKLTCHSPCFRSEAGSYGKDTKGMIRQHQFEKIELVQFVDPKNSSEALESIVEHAETILKNLELPYRTVLLCGADIGFSAAKTYDIEVWIPSQESYREISSCSNFRDFQARRSMIRWRNTVTGKPELVHTLNGSGLAVGRTLVAIMENYQLADGSIEIPKVLQKFMGSQTVIGSKVT
ncbi:MAG: serine--tRNA ligase [Porticoccus sp.]|jgi:seryl-tRNA synthetase|nr:serine--tRNA ligase [Porticoccus sp.]